ncbi:aldo/keto reductase [Jatrophihabitans fulvus]
MDAVSGSARVVLGHSDISVRAIGLGCMGMSQFFGETDDAQSTDTIRAALDLGVDFFDTSDIYGAADTAPGALVRFGHNEELLGRALAGRRDEAVIATKFAVSRDAGDGRIVLNGRPEYVRSACEASLRRLGVDHVDLYYYHRVDPSIPIEETVGAMADLVGAGKVRALGLSEVTSETLGRAHAVHAITALQSEYSLWERGLETDIIPTCRRLGVTLVPYAPLGRAALTGRFTAQTTFDATDFRATNPRFSEQNLAHNLEPVQVLHEMAERKACRPGQLALAWLLAQPLDVVPIPGTKRVSYLTENAAASSVPISADEVAHLAQVFAPGTIVGRRYAAAQASRVPAPADRHA